MAKTEMTIDWNDGSPAFNPPPGATTLKDGDKIIVTLTGLAKGQSGSIDRVDIYNNQVVDGQNTKGTLNCSWTRTGGNTCGSIYDIAARTETKVKIEDVDNPSADVVYWFGVGGATPSPWSVDPELINKPGGG